MKWGLVLLSLGVGIAQGAYFLHWFQRYSHAVTNAVSFASESAEIARINEFLNMSVRLHATTGASAWRQRYMSHVKPLETALESAFTLVVDEGSLRALDRVADSNEALIALRKEALELTAKGRLQEAQALLTSFEYARLEFRYKKGLKEALETTHAVLQGEIQRNRDMVLMGTIVPLISLLVLSELWRRLSLAEQRHAAGQIEASLKREQQLSSLQRQFVSILSHELRTPLAIIDGKAQRLEIQADKLAPNQIRSSGDVIRDAVKQLTGLMEGVLNVSRIEEGRIDINREIFDPAALVEKVVAGHREVDGSRRIDLALADLPATAYGDPRLLTQVVSNLVSNALKYSDHCAPVRVEGFQMGNDVVIAVHDEGVGIPKEEIDRLGERFFRASSSAGISGTGIGLHFIKHLIDLHNGRLEVKSTEGIGSSFTVHLPQRSANQAAPASARPEPAAPDLVPA